MYYNNHRPKATGPRDYKPKPPHYFLFFESLVKRVEIGSDKAQTSPQLNYLMEAGLELNP